MNPLDSATYRSDVISVSKDSCVPWKELSNARILVTGATGLIGSCIADVLLARGDNHAVLAGRDVERLETRFSTFRGQYEVLEYDALRPLNACGEFDYVVHCASNAHPVAYSTEPVETARANVLGTDALLSMLRQQRHGRMLYVSSSEVYGKGVAFPCNEGASGFVNPLDPRSCYPNSKRMAETLCASYLEEYGVDSVILRPGHVYGPTASAKDSRAHSQFARNAAARENIVLKSAGAQIRSYCHVLDCATAALKVLLDGESGHAYNVSNPASVATIRDLAEAFARSAGTRVVFEAPSNAEVKGANRMDRSDLDASSLLALGWLPRWGLDEGTAETIRVMKEAWV